MPLFPSTVYFPSCFYYLYSPHFPGPLLAGCDRIFSCYLWHPILHFYSVVELWRAPSSGACRSCAGSFLWRPRDFPARLWKELEARVTRRAQSPEQEQGANPRVWEPCPDNQRLAGRHCPAWGCQPVAKAQPSPAGKQLPSRGTAEPPSVTDTT